MDLEGLGLAPGGEIRGVLVQHDGLGEGGDGGLAPQRLGELLLLSGLAPEQDKNINTKAKK